MEEDNKGADVISIDSAKKPEEVDEAPKEKTTAELGLEGEHRRQFWEAAFWKLTENPKFVKLLQDNFTIGAHPNDETKMIDVLVVEKQNVPVAITGDQIFKIGVACMQSGAKDVKAFTTRIMGILGHKEAPSILPATELDMANIRKRLDP